MNLSDSVFKHLEKIYLGHIFSNFSSQIYSTFLYLTLTSSFSSIHHGRSKVNITTEAMSLSFHRRDIFYCPHLRAHCFFTLWIMAQNWVSRCQLNKHVHLFCVAWYCLRSLQGLANGCEWNMEKLRRPETISMFPNKVLGNSFLIKDKW